MARERYDDLIYELGDLARERLVHRPNPPRALGRVLKAEEVLLARQAELEALEKAMDDEEADHEAFLAEVADEREDLQATVKQYRRAVDAIQGKVKSLRKRVAALKMEVRADKGGLAKMEERHRDLEMTGQAGRLDASRTGIKRFRIALMRKTRHLEEAQGDLERALTPTPGAPGAPGILAHRKLLELEDEVKDRAAENEARMADLDKQLAAKELELKAAEEYLDEALFLLGEASYEQRIPEPALAGFYGRLDNSK